MLYSSGGEISVGRNKTYKYTINTVKNATKILKAFTVSRTYWTLTELANHLNINISNMQRLLNTLVEYNYLIKNESTKQYSLGYMILNLSGIIKTTMEVHKEAQPFLEELADELDDAVHLGILEGTKIVYLDKIDAKHPIRLSSHIGKRKPSYCTACGKVMLAFQKEIKLHSLVNKIEKTGFIRYGKNTVRNSTELIEQLTEIRAQEYAICIDEFLEVISIGAPVRDYTGEVIAAISITSRVYRIKETEIPFYLEKVIDVSKKISKNLGHYG